MTAQGDTAAVGRGGRVRGGRVRGDAAARLRAIAFWVLAAALAVCHVLVAWQSLVVNRLWEDEAFNLTVPLNLLAGLGYTSDGTLSGSELTPFDPRISTGPTVLLPIAAVLATGADPVIGARLVPLLYWGLLLAGLWILGLRLAGRWAGLAAVAAPLVFDPTRGDSPIQGPADILGEIPAAALLVWALVVLPRRRWLAGLLVGLAIQTKLIALLALPAFAVALWALAPGRGWRRLGTTARRAWLPLLLAGAPTALFELAALLQLGVPGFLDHLRTLKWFVLSNGQTAATTPLEKLATLAESWFVPSWLLLPAAAALIALIAWAAWTARRAEGGLPPLVLAVLSAAVVGLLAYVGWWSTATHTPLWVRHPAVGVYAFAPLLVALAVWAARALHETRDARERAGARPRLIGVSALVAVVAAFAAVGSVAAVAAPTRPQTLAHQRADAAPIAEWAEATGTRWLAAEPWGGPVSIVVLAGTHVGLWDAPDMADVPRLAEQPCATEVLVDGPTYRVCAAPTR